VDLRIGAERNREPLRSCDHPGSAVPLEPPMLALVRTAALLAVPGE
jgi:hypothetical protein